jgi:peptide/nickel transport system substrate-binding protein
MLHKKLPGITCLKITALSLLLLILPLLVACADEPTGQTNTQDTTGDNRNGRPTGSATGAPTVPPATPTYTPLPVTPTLAPTATPPVVTGGKLSGAVLNDALTLHPYKANNETGQTYLQLLFAASLTKRDPLTFLPAPNAAASWKVNDTTVTFTLRDGLKWSDGAPITSSDYLWTYQQLRKPENGWSLAPEALYNPNDPRSAGIESYEAPDPRTLVIKLHAASSDIISRADVIEPLPRQVWEKGDWNDPAKNPQANAPTVVSGPWKLKEWKRGNYITFERNPASTVYPAPRLDSLTFYVVPDSQVALQKVKSGEVDFYTPAASDFAGFARLPNVQAYTWGPGRPTWYFAGFNFRKPALQDKLLRQALAWAVDRQAILEKQAFGLGRLINSSVSPWNPAFNPNTARYELNLAKARDLLKQGGYTVKDGKLTDKTGKVISLKLVYNAPSPLYEGLANTLKANFAALGITVELRNFDFSNYNRFLASSEADFDLFLSGWTADYAPENFGDVWRAGLEFNSGSYDNSRLLDMYAKASGEPDATARKEWLDQVQSIEAEDLPYLFLYAELGRMVANKRVAGFATNLLGPGQNLYTDWFVTK